MKITPDRLREILSPPPMCGRSLEEDCFLLCTLPAGHNRCCAVDLGESPELVRDLAEDLDEARAQVEERSSWPTPEASEIVGAVHERARCVRLARGCVDYQGGYGGDLLAAYHHGMQTVVNVLIAAEDYQTRVVEAVGAEIERRDRGEVAP